MTKPPASASAGLLLLLINALLWLAFGIITAGGAHPGIPDVPLMRWGMALLALASAALMLGLNYFLRRHSRVAYFAALGLLAAIALLLVADQFGLPDLVVLILTVAPIVLLVKERAWFLQLGPSTAGRNRAA